MYFVKNKLAVVQVSCICLHIIHALKYEANSVLVLQICICSFLPLKSLLIMGSREWEHQIDKHRTFLKSL